MDINIQVYARNYKMRFCPREDRYIYWSKTITRSVNSVTGTMYVNEVLLRTAFHYYPTIVLI